MKPKQREIKPSKFVRDFFCWFCNDHLSEAALGDMVEIYTRRRKTMSKFRADLLFLLNVIEFIQPFALKSKNHHSHYNHYAMFKNYYKIAWRRMNSQKMYTAITIGGFALGLATCILIFLFIRDETSFDKHYANGDRTFRLYNDYQGKDMAKWTSMPASVAGIIEHDFPEVEKTGRLIPYKWFNAGSNLVRNENVLENTYEEGFAYADQSLLEILEIPMVYGNQLHALDKPKTIVISRKMAEKYFGDEDPVGKAIILNDDKESTFTIGGVMENFSSHSHLQFNFLITLTGVEFWPGEQASWCCWNYDNYLRLRPGANPADLEKKLLSIRENHQIAYLKETGDQSLEDVRKYHYYRLQKLEDIHLNPQGIDDMFSHGDVRYLWLFGSVAGFILILACINFINLSTARSANRAKEVGLRKVVGSVRSALVRQFLTESLMYSFLSFILAIVLVVLTIPYFNVLAAKSLALPLTAWWFLPMLLMSALVIGTLSGIYPSFYLSAFSPLQVLKGSISRGARSSGLRSVMVVFQFTTSIILIIGTLVVNRQMDFILHAKVGFDKEHVLMIQGSNTLGNLQQAFKEELKNLTNVSNVSISYYLPVAGTNRDQNGFWKRRPVKN